MPERHNREKQIDKIIKNKFQNKAIIKFTAYLRYTNTLIMLKRKLWYPARRTKSNKNTLMQWNSHNIFVGIH